MQAGDKVLCVRAPEEGIPITEGQEYTVKRVFVGNQRHDEACIEGMEKTPGCQLEEADGHFTQDRFQVIPC